MFKCRELAKYMDYHAHGRSQDSVMRMAPDSKYWKDINEKWPHLRTTYSVWPILIINNSLPPWMAMKKEHAMLTLIIPSIRTYECNSLLTIIYKYFIFVIP